MHEDGPMEYPQLVKLIADILKALDDEKPVHKTFHPGIGPYGEPQIVREVAQRLTSIGIRARTRRSPDLDVCGEWAIEFKIVRPFGDNGRVAEDWSVNMLHPYPGNVSLIGDGVKLSNSLPAYPNKGLFVIGFEHNPATFSLDPLIESFELIARRIMNIALGERIEEKRIGLCHPHHQVLRCIAWKLNK
jgi:hypothetical protein